MRTFWIVGLLLVVAAVQAASPERRVVNLDKPGALDAIASENPEHYQKIMGILRVSQVEACETLPRTLKVQFDADAASCRAYELLTSQPPKRHLRFRLGDTDYVTNAVQTNLGGKLTPAK
jgi:hypothetical protein